MSELRSLTHFVCEGLHSIMLYGDKIMETALSCLELREREREMLRGIIINNLLTLFRAANTLVLQICQFDLAVKF